MEEKTTSGSSFKKYVLPLTVVGILVIGAIFFFTQNATTQPGQNTTSEMTQQEQTTQQTTSPYKNGTYEANGSYVTPGGQRDIDLSITITDGVVTESTFVGNATDATSKRFQGEFGEGYKQMIVGKNIDEVSLTKVAGSSLTPKGFTDALEKIKAEAKS